MILSCLRVLALRIRLGKRVEVGFDNPHRTELHIHRPQGWQGAVARHLSSRSVTIECDPNALLEIGKSFVGPGSIVSAMEHVSMGDGSLLVDYVTIRDQNHVQSPEVPLYSWRYTTVPNRLVGHEIRKGRICVTCHPDRD
jgi:hypothetical protein